MGSDKYLTILIVDDNPVNLMLLKATLVKAGYHILMVNNGPEARAMAAKCRPDLILLDIMMPGEDGFEVMRRLRENPETVAIPSDRFFLFTDGLIERPDDRQVWTRGVQGLLEASALIKDCPVSESAIRLKDILMGDIVPKDDVVVLGFEV